VAEHGTLDVLSSPAKLKERLEKFYGYLKPKNAAKARFIWLRRNIGAKTLSLFLAFLFWAVFAFRADTIHRTFVVPIEWRNLPANFIIDNPKPMDAHVSLSGTERDFNIDPNSMVISLDLGSVREGTQELPLTDRNILNRPPGTTISQIDPRAIKLRAYGMTEIELPVKIRLEKSLPGRLKLLDAAADPERVKVMVPEERKEDSFRSIRNR